MLPGRMGLPPTQFRGRGARFSERSRQHKTATKPPGFGSQNCSTQAYCNIKNTLKTNNKAKDHCRKLLSDSSRCPKLSESLHHRTRFVITERRHEFLGSGSRRQGFYHSEPFAFDVVVVRFGRLRRPKIDANER